MYPITVLSESEERIMTSELNQQAQAQAQAPRAQAGGAPQGLEDQKLQPTSRENAWHRGQEGFPCVGGGDDRELRVWSVQL